MTDNPSRILRLAAAVALMALAANCFLKYLWWTACYGAWYGIPKLAEQWKAAGARASFNGWSLILLDAASVAVLFSLIRLRSIETSTFLKSAVRLALSLTITIAGTAAFALALSWLKQGTH
jgi:hypothetical protein